MQTEYDSYKLIDLFPQLYVKDRFPQLYVRISFSHIWKTLSWLHYFNKRGGLVPRNSLTLHIVIEILVPTQESVRASIYVLGVTILPLSMVVILDFATVPIVLLFCCCFCFILLQPYYHPSLIFRSEACSSVKVLQWLH